MPVQNTLTQGISNSSFTHINPMVQTVDNERQPQRQITLTMKGWQYRDEWLGTSQEISSLLCTLVPNISAYVFTENENFTIDRQKGDLSRLTHTYTQYAEPLTGNIEGTQPDSTEDTVGITPWSIRTETTDIDALNYWIILKQLTSAQQATIKRDRLALWENSPIAQKAQYKYKTTNPTNMKEGYVTVDRNPSTGESDSPLTLEFAKWYYKMGRKQFPLTTIRVTHKRLVAGQKYSEYKQGQRPTISLKNDISAIQFPEEYFGKELSSIPDCPYQINIPNLLYTLEGWNLENYNGKSEYLETLEYISYPKYFPNPIDPTPYYENDNVD